jgi:hypothetical protein
MRADFAGECESIVCGIWSAGGQIELRCGYTLRRDHVLRKTNFCLPSTSGANDLERAHLIAAAFATLRGEIEHAIVGFHDDPYDSG